jgi:hypothetical protein
MLSKSWRRYGQVFVPTQIQGHIESPLKRPMEWIDFLSAINRFINIIKITEILHHSFLALSQIYYCLTFLTKKKPA